MNPMPPSLDTIAEKLHLQKKKKYRLNGHVHSTVSDGQLSPQEIVELADAQNMLFSITDHLRIDAYNVVDSSRIIPGVEVKVAEGGVDFLVHTDTREELETFFREVVVPANPGNTMYGPTRLQVHRLLGEAFDRKAHVVVPHYATAEGLSVLDTSAQEAVAKYPVFMEMNGRVGRAKNRQAKKFASTHNLPLIASGDSHLRSQYTDTHTTFKLQKASEPTADEVFAALRLRRVQFLLKHASWLDTIRTGVASAKSMMLQRDGLLYYLCNAARNSFGKRGIEDNRPTASQQLQETLETADVDDAVDS
ncbi:hypothetical protein COU78_05865 [Candidatus Peregrinibacteria bacterium CG10_big_fil_rev_8_21_14_0_10_49_24]|nr:MAG: hypothetical protein COV83_04570 [Candidatus Peregrinibacteria bacterium CG11_big_fil_rev_8_21_14_0_20_49_14]PIR50547.1 MAG: hypothetical protein COU78_05865 [Candidatus Peregrinibacteria bacterium CG10_big_fil_rev_8_21_14_0_10_49_24]PJA67916.1 MAG: hypothetical protein CO157_02030 [Candidatus Peregrinibacteria bacterium CG_4_9_14_3_um_filter_49_12]